MNSAIYSYEFMWLGLGAFLLGVFLTLLGVSMLLKRRMLLAGFNGTLGLSLLVTATIAILILLNLHTYFQLTSEIELAQVEIGDKTEQGIAVRILVEDARQEFFIKAAEWQLDARFLKWKPWAYLIGSEPLVRLESISGRKPFERQMPIESYDLPHENRILSEIGSKLSEWMGMVDTYYGSSVYMPAVEGSVYSVSATISGLVARAENQTAKQAIAGWMHQ